MAFLATHKKLIIRSKENILVLTVYLVLQTYVMVLSCMFVPMQYNRHSKRTYPAKYLVWDMRDCYTWSFPEFVPFCSQLYYFSSFKAFKSLSQA